MFPNNAMLPPLAGKRLPPLSEARIKARNAGIGAVSVAKILCVDDDEVVLLGAQALLGNRFEIFTATSGAAGLELMDSIRPEWVVVDYQMPIMDGARFMLQARQSGHRAKFILLTGLDVGRLDWEGLNPLGLVGHLRKPLDAGRLLEMLEGA